MQLLRSIGFLLMGLLQVGGASWIEIAHVLACDCCVEETAGGDCCSSAEESDKGCACAVVPEDSAPPRAPVADGGSLRHQIALGWELAPFRVSIDFAPPLRRPPRVPTTAPPDRVLHGSGGERSSFLGCALS